MTVLQAYLAGLQRFGIQPGLERIQALLERVGNPHFQYPVVLVGGTNGKGSTCEFLARMLADEGSKNRSLHVAPSLSLERADPRAGYTESEKRNTE
jgi:Folylpolyglutamate synthase